MMERETVDAVFERAKTQGRAALIAFLTAGFPSLDTTRELVDAACDGGADIIELGFPYSDPLADGPAIQASSQRALEAGATFDAVLDAAARVKVRQPLIAFTYYNPLFARGLMRAAADLAGAGFSGAIVPDLPPEESAPLEASFRAHELFLSFLVSPTTPLARAKEIAARSRGFVYVVSRTGVTGVHAGIGSGLDTTIEALRTVTQRPLAVGFGIATPAQAHAVARRADGVIVGSALVQASGKPQPAEAVRALCASLSSACVKEPLKV